MADEDELRRIELHLVGQLRDDPRQLEFAQREGVTPSTFRNPWAAKSFEEVVERCKKPIEGLPPYVLAIPYRPHVSKWARQLVAAEPSRQPWAPEPPPADDEEPKPVVLVTAPAATTTRRRRRQLSKEFLQCRINYRTGNLEVLARHLHTSVDAIQAMPQFAERDVSDPEDELVGVDDREIGRALRLTMVRMFEIEDAESAKRAKRGEDRFAFRTIAPYDKTRDEVKAERKSRNRERAKAKKKEKKMQLQSQTVQEGHRTWAEEQAEQKARVRHQRNALLDAIRAAENWSSIAELKEAVRRHPAWRALADKPGFRTILSRRLDELLERKLIVQKYENGRRYVRLVAHLTPARSV